MVSSHCNHHAILGWFWHEHPGRTGAGHPPSQSSALNVRSSSFTIERLPARFGAAMFGQKKRPFRNERWRKMPKLKRSARAKDRASRRTDHLSMTSASGARSSLYPGVLVGALAGIGGTLVMLQGTWTADRMIVAQHIGQILGAACIGALFGYFVARVLQAR
jgi:hypothetical protein